MLVLTSSQTGLLPLMVVSQSHYCLSALLILSPPSCQLVPVAISGALTRLSSLGLPHLKSLGYRSRCLELWGYSTDFILQIKLLDWGSDLIYWYMDQRQYVYSSSSSAYSDLCSIVSMLFM